MIIFTISFVAAFFSSLSGCGASVVTIPSWIIMGYSVPACLCADKISACFFTPFAARNYLKNQTLNWKFILVATAVGCVGALAAINLSVSLDEEVLKRIIGFIIMVFVTLAALDANHGFNLDKASQSRSGKAFMGFPLGFYEGFLGSGNGILTSFILTKTMGYDLIKALGIYYFMAFFWSFSAMVFLVREGYFDLNLVVYASLGASLGGHYGSKLGSKKGAKFIKRLYVVVGFLLGVKLLSGL